jgi:hypothetical protein
MSECKVFRREIEEAADGGAMGADASAHAALCRACGDELRERGSLRALVGGLGKVDAPADFEFRLRARMSAAKIDRGHGRFSGARWLYGFAPVAVAACFVVVSATLYFRQAPRPQKSDATAVAVSPPRNTESDRASSINNIQSRPAESSAVAAETVTKVNQPRVASPRTYRPVQKVNARAVQSREVAAKAVGRTGVEPGTLESSVTGAQVIRLSPEPLRVILRDERGAERVVPMRSVSFGSQNFLSRGTAAKSAAAVEVGGVW